MTTKDAAQQRWQQSDAPGKEAANRAESTQVLDRFFKLLAYVCPVLLYKPNISSFGSTLSSSLVIHGRV